MKRIRNRWHLKQVLVAGLVLGLSASGLGGMEWHQADDSRAAEAAPAGLAAMMATGSQSEQADISQAMGGPLRFEENVGQADAAVLFQVHLADGTVGFLRDRVIFALHAETAETAAGPPLLGDLPSSAMSPDDLPEFETTVTILEWQDASGDAGLTGLHPQDTQTTYFMGDSRTGDITTYDEVLYTGLWPGIDVRFYTAASGSLEFDVIVAPGADPAVARFTFEGDLRPSIGGDGSLVVGDGPAALRLKAPHTYQNGPAGRMPVESAYEVGADGSVGYRLGDYDPRRELVIDPILESYSVWGGAGNTYVWGTAQADDGSIWFTGSTGDRDILQNLDALQQRPGGYSTDGFLYRFMPGEGVTYATYLGGGYSDEIQSLLVDSQGRIVLTGVTNSPDFPGLVREPGWTSWVEFVLRLTADGTQIDRMAASNGYHYLGRIIELNNGDFLHTYNSYVHYTRAANGGFQTTNAGGYDIYVARIDGEDLHEVAGTYLGGGLHEYVQDIVELQDGSFLLGGTTGSSNFPATADGQAYDPDVMASWDGWFAKISSDLSELQYSSYVGGIGYDTVNAVAQLPDGRLMLAGHTASDNFPVTNNAHQLGFAGGKDAWWHVLDDQFDLTYGTFYGGPRDDWLTQILATEDAIWMSGQTRSLYPTLGWGGRLAGHDSIAFKLDGDAEDIIWTVPVGGSRTQAVSGLDLGSNGFPILSGYAYWYLHGIGGYRPFVMELGPCGPDAISSIALEGPQAAGGIYVGDVWATATAAPHADCAVDHMNMRQGGGDYDAVPALRIATDGTHTIEAFATLTDRDEGPSTSIQVVRDTTPPALRITSPDRGDGVLGAIPSELAPSQLPVILVADTVIEATSDDAIAGVARVEFYIDGDFAGSDTVAPYTYDWSTTHELLGEHVLEVRSWDLAGNGPSHDQMTVTVVPTQEDALCRSAEAHGPTSADDCAQLGGAL